MKKRIIAITAALMMFAAPAMAQVFLADEEFNDNRAGNTAMNIPNPAIYDSGDDWYAPVGEGIFVLAGLAGAYLIGKRRKEE